MHLNGVNSKCCSVSSSSSSGLLLLQPSHNHYYCYYHRLVNNTIASAISNSILFSSFLKIITTITFIIHVIAPLLSLPFPDFLCWRIFLHRRRERHCENIRYPGRESPENHHRRWQGCRSTSAG